MEFGEQDNTKKNVDDLFAEHFDELVDVFSNMGVDPTMINPHLIDEQEKVQMFTNRVTEAITPQDPTDEEMQVAYRTLQMTYSLFSYASKTVTRIHFNDFIEVLTTAQDPTVMRAYANSHVHVMNLFDRLRPIIDPECEYAGLTNTMALLTCMAIEKDLAKSDWKDADVFASRLELWDGNVTNLAALPKSAFEHVESSLLRTKQDVCEYLATVNDYLKTMAPGEERDSFADSVCVELNTAWAELGMMDMPYTFSGAGIYPSIETFADEDGTDSYKYTIASSVLSITGQSLGFAYKSMEPGVDTKLWFKVYFGSKTDELHPTLEREYSLYAYFDETCIVTIAEDTNAEESVMSESEIDQFNGIEDPDEIVESYYSDAAQILSICSQGLRRRMNSRAFYAMSHGQQLQVVDAFITAATERSQIINMTAEFEPHHAFVMRPAFGDANEKVLTKIQFGDVALSGLVKEITVHDVDTLLARPIRSKNDRSLSVPGLLVAVEVRDAHILPNNVVLRSAERVLVPLSGQDFEGTFKFTPPQDSNN